MASIFLSHNAKDKPFVRRLASDLCANGVDVWLDEAEMKPGDSLIRKISAGIDRCGFVGVVLSPNSVASRWVQEEVEIALTRQIEGHRVTVIPMLLNDCKIPTFLRHRLYADFRRRRGKPYQAAILKVLDAIMPGGFRERIFSVVRNAITAEMAAYQNLPTIKLNQLDQWFTKDGSARRRIVHVLKQRRKQQWVINNESNPSAHVLRDIHLQALKGGEAVVETEEYLYLRWYSLKEKRYRYIYDEKNKQTYILKRPGGRWQVDANIYPQPTSSRRIK